MSYDLKTYSLPRDKRYIDRYYPRWGILVDKITERSLKASDIKRILGLSYRQLNDWEERGILKSRSKRVLGEKAKGWRRFSIQDLIPLGILMEAKRLGFPVTKFQKAMGTIFLFQFFVFDDFPSVVYGIDFLFITNLNDMFMFHPIDPKDSSEKIELWLPEIRQTDAVVIINMKPIIENIFEKLNAADFEAIKNPEGGYRFTINGKPFDLEELPADEVESEVE